MFINYYPPFIFKHLGFAFYLLMSAEINSVNFYVRLAKIHNLWKQEINKKAANSLCILRGKYLENSEEAKQPRISIFL